jgi:hypothetical protein
VLGRDLHGKPVPIRDRGGHGGRCQQREREPAAPLFANVNVDINRQLAGIGYIAWSLVYAQPELDRCTVRHSARRLQAGDVATRRIRWSQLYNKMPGCHR